jgi:anti-sigma B factor antagonist
MTIAHAMREQNGVTVFALQVKHLDAMSVPTLRPAVEQLIDRGGIKVVLDMAFVEIIDSSGVGLVVSLFKRLRALGGALAITGVAGQPREIFQIMRLDKALSLFASTDDALRSF